MINWIRKSFVIKISLVLILFGFSIVLIMSVIDYRREQGELKQVVKNQIDDFSTVMSLIVAEDVRYENYFSLWRSINEVHKNYKLKEGKKVLFDVAEIAVIDLEGRVLGHSDPAEYSLLSEYISKNKTEALSGDLADLKSVANAWFASDKMKLNLTSPIKLGGEHIGNLIVCFDRTPLQGIINSVFDGFLYAQLYIIAIVVALAFLFGRWVGRPIQQVVQESRFIGSGKLSLQSLLKRKDEFYQLGSAIKAADQRISKHTKAIQESERKIRRTIDNLGSEFYLYALNADGVFTYFSPTMTDMLGYTGEELLVNYAKLLADRPSNKMAIHHLEESLSGKKQAPYVIEVLNKQGNRHFIEVSETPVFNEEGKVVSVEGIAHEVTARKKSEESLLYSQERLEESQRIAKLGSWELDLVNNKLEWSKEIFNIFEIDPELFGASYEAFIELVHPDDRKQVHKAYQDSLRDKKRYVIEYRLLMKGGRIKYVIEQCDTDYDVEEEPIRSFGTVQDITDRKLIEDLNARWGYIFDHSINEIYIFDKNSFRFVQVSQGAVNNLGYSQEELRKFTAYDIKPDFTK